MVCDLRMGVTGKRKHMLLDENFQLYGSDRFYDKYVHDFVTGQYVVCMWYGVCVCVSFLVLKF